VLGRYRSDLRNVVGSSASAYGYTLTIWSTGMVLSYAYGPPSPPLQQRSKALSRLRSWTRLAAITFWQDEYYMLVQSL